MSEKIILNKKAELSKNPKMKEMRVYHSIEDFVNHLSASLGNSGKCSLSCRLRTYRDAEGIDYAFEAVCNSLGLMLRTGCRISYEDRSPGDGDFISVLKEKVAKKGLSERVNFH